MAKILGLFFLVALVAGGIYLAVYQNNSLFKTSSIPSIKPVTQSVAQNVSSVVSKITPTPQDSDVAQYQKLSEEDNLASMDSDLKSLDNMEKDFDANLKQL